MESVISRNNIRLSKSCLREGEKAAVMEVLDRGFLGMGAEVKLFEERLCDFIGRPAVCVVNGTAALHLALQSISIGPGDEVLVQSLTYVASFQAISATGAKAVACDVDPSTLLLDLNDAEKRITANTKALMLVHYRGDVGDLEHYYRFAKKHGLRVIEDAAHAFGGIYQNGRIGSTGDIVCFSFDGIKNITSGEGGCVVSDDAEVLQKLRDSRLLGVEKDTEQRFASQRSWHFDVKAQGWRYHMSNIMAAIGIEQLKRFPQMAIARQKLARHYDRILETNSAIQIFATDYELVVPHIYVVCLAFELDRAEIRSRLLELGIETGVHYAPNHRLTMYMDAGADRLPTTESIADRLLTLPLHPELNLEDIEAVCKELKLLCN